MYLLKRVPVQTVICPGNALLSPAQRLKMQAFAGPYNLAIPGHYQGPANACKYGIN